MTGPPATPHVNGIDLGGRYTVDRAELPPALAPPTDDGLFGERTVLGIAWRFGVPGAPNVILVDGTEVEVPLPGVRATYVLVVHAVEDRATVPPAGLGDGEVYGNEAGGVAAEYRLRFEDGSLHRDPIARRFAIQQARTGWGASAFTAMPARDPEVFPTSGEASVLGIVSRRTPGWAENRQLSGRDTAEMAPAPRGLLWVHAIANPRPDEPIAALHLRAGAERVCVYAAGHTLLEDHPLRPGCRRTFRLRVPEAPERDALGGLVGLSVDLGSVLSCRPALDYDEARWRDPRSPAAPTPSPDEVQVEVAAHPRARLLLAAGGGAPLVLPLDEPDDRLRPLPPPTCRTRIRIVDAETGAALAARLHLHGGGGEYLAPIGHQRLVNDGFSEDTHADLAVGRHQYAYVDGACEVDLPVGTIHVEIAHGFAYDPLRTTVELPAEDGELTFPLVRALRIRERGWIAADTHVHFLSPQSAAMIGRAEGLSVVNLLATQWGERSSGVGDFDGESVVGGDRPDPCLVRVGTENRTQVLGHLSLLGYRGPMILPLCTGGPTESALGDPLETTMIGWARRCREQGGLVVLPHAPDPDLEGAALVVLGLVDAVELMSENPLRPDAGQLRAAGLASWYRYLGLGYHLPLVGGSDKMSAGMLLGGIRTYSRIEGELDYAGWLASIRSGDTFASVGPVVELEVDGVRPGGCLDLEGSATVEVRWSVESAALPADLVEVVVGGLPVHAVPVDGGRRSMGSTRVDVAGPTWVAVRVRGSYRGDRDDVAAHTSAVLVAVGGRRPFDPRLASALEVLVDGAVAYVRELAPRRGGDGVEDLVEPLLLARRTLGERIAAEGAAD